MIFSASLGVNEKNVWEYLFFARMLGANVIKVSDNGEIYYFFVSEDGMLSNLKYSKENLLDEDYLRDIAVFVSENIKVNRYNFLTLENYKNSNLCYNVIYDYSASKISGEVKKYVDRFSRLFPKITISKVDKNNLKDFYFIYNIFSGSKWFNVKGYDFFEHILLWSDAQILNISLWENLVWSIVLLKMFNNILPLYWWYDEFYVKKGLKYFVNNYIIDYYKNDDEINGVIFWTWRDEGDINDSLFEFKSKFWECYILNRIQWYL